MITEDCKIISNTQLATGLWKMSFRSLNISSQDILPGQFISIRINESWDHPLRRPMSIAGVRQDVVSIIYKIFGSGTHELSTKTKGDSVNILGPLGNNFTGWDRVAKPILVGGGVGLAPILFLHEQCQQMGIQSILVVGAKTSKEHFLDHDPSNHLYLTTDDNSLGINGTVLDALQPLSISDNNVKIFACGPEPMLIALQSFAISQNIEAQLAVESYMACGFGICQGCAIRRNTKRESLDKHTYHKKYSLVCMDGPVYEANEVLFD
jgi:dihydroorotate dehydrogenase electron transfer subunit